MKEKYVKVNLEVLELDDDIILTSGGGGVDSCTGVGGISSDACDVYCVSQSTSGVEGITCNSYCGGFNC